jgi:uncharacterized damage-inducible protein DinB
MKVNYYINQLEEIYSGKPWYGEPVLNIFNQISPEDAVEKLTPVTHSIAELVFHMITWRDFAVKLLQGDEEFDVKQNDRNDWRELNLKDENLWRYALSEFDKTHKMLISELNNFNEVKLNIDIPLRNYNYEFLLTGLIQHDIYHLGQISLIKSILKKH